MSSVEEVATVRIRTARFAELLAEYEHLGMNADELQARKKAFVSGPFQGPLPAQVSSVEEYRCLSVETRELERGQVEQRQIASDSLEAIYKRRSEILHSVLVPRYGLDAEDGLSPGFGESE